MWVFEFQDLSATQGLVVYQAEPRNDFKKRDSKLDHLLEGTIAGRARGGIGFRVTSRSPLDPGGAKKNWDLG